MGLFHKTLGDIGKELDKGKTLAALEILNEHLSAEKEFMEDLAGLQEASREYLRQLQDMKALLTLPENVMLKTTFKEREFSKTVTHSQEKVEKMKKGYMEDLKRKVAVAKDKCRIVEAILVKLWHKDRRKLE